MCWPTMSSYRAHDRFSRDREEAGRGERARLRQLSLSRATASST
jgi:hypothetical protein